jgi:hypothetical protein
MFRLGAITTGGKTNPSDNLSLTKRALVGWMSGSRTQRNGIALAEGFYDFRTKYFGWGPPWLAEPEGLSQNSVWLRTGRSREVRSPAEVKDFSSNFCVQTGSEAHPVSCKMGTGGGVLSPGVKSGQGVTLTTHPHLKPRSWRSSRRLHRCVVGLLYLYLHDWRRLAVPLYQLYPGICVITEENHGNPQSG